MLGAGPGSGWCPALFRDEDGDIAMMKPLRLARLLVLSTALVAPAVARAPSTPAGPAGGSGAQNVGDAGVAADPQSATNSTDPQATTAPDQQVEETPEISVPGDE